MIALARVAALVLVVALAPLAAGAQGAGRATDRPWIFAADIHLDPTGRFANGKYGQDTNPELLASAIRQMQQVDPDPPVVVLDGDFLAHIFIERKQAAATIGAIAQQFDRAFPHAQFLLALGNEDSDCGDYGVPASSAFLGEIARAWEPLVNRHGAAPDFLRTFPVDGFYVTHLPLPGLRAIVLDDVFWSPRYRNACDGSAHPGGQTLHDLRAALQTPAAGPTWIMLHIPPGIDAFSTAHLAHNLVVVPFLDPGAKDAFVAAATAPNRPVHLIVAAHTHKFAFRIAGDGDGATPMLLVPSISPIFKNAPSFLTVHVDANATIVAAEDWTRIDGVWADRGRLASLGMPDLSVVSILALQHRLENDPAARALFARLYNGDAPPEINESNWRTYWCAATDLSAVTFRGCMSEGGFSIITSRGLKLIIAALVVLLIVIVLVALQLRARRRRAADGSAG